MFGFLVLVVALLGMVTGLDLRPSNDTVSPQILRDIYVFAAYSHAAYCGPNRDGNPGNSLCFHPPCAGIISPGTTTRFEFSSKTAPIAGNVAVMDRGLDKDAPPTVVVSFRGSGNLGNLIQSFRFKLVDFPLCANCSVHTGFMDTYTQIKHDLSQALNRNVEAALVKRRAPEWENVEGPVYGKHPERLEGKKRDSDDKMEDPPVSADGGKPGISPKGDRKEYMKYLKQVRDKQKSRDKAWRKTLRDKPSSSRYHLFKPDGNTLFYGEPAPRIVFTGHSYGGAVATIAAAHYRAYGHIVDLYTYGSPRVGNSFFAEFASRGPFPRLERSGSRGSPGAPHGGITARVTNKRDIIVSNPPMAKPFNYAHVTPEYWFSEGIANPAFPYNLQVCHGVRELTCASQFRSFTFWNIFDMCRRMIHHAITIYSNDANTCADKKTKIRHHKRDFAGDREGVSVEIADVWF
ncbi:hypothetical protein CDD82_1909 [Ophiocordyceps australis]|uniref:Fungal lipase-type domain-containing protein n=1 Tax=Ophiocordyceps australis TaxID=1399860 RepID=A0A2C5Y7M6_9HYPO|nr:hypothetical protein CDD82_1909 [Ophiocordyceps australis]